MAKCSPAFPLIQRLTYHPVLRLRSLTWCVDSRFWILLQLNFAPSGQTLKALTQFTSRCLCFGGISCLSVIQASAVNSNDDDATIYWMFTRYHTYKCVHTHINTYRMWLNAKIWFLSVVWKTCSNFWIVVLFAHLFLRLIYVYRLLLSLYLSVYKSTCWAWPSGVGNKIYHLHFHK